MYNLKSDIVTTPKTRFREGKRIVLKKATQKMLTFR